jgi:magnesium chelatase subunit D
LNVGDDRLLGGLDLSATLQAGRPVAEQGILARADGGVITLSMAERLSSGTAAKIGCVMDRHEVVMERDGFARRAQARFAVIALDEGIEPDERPPDSLLERLALHLDLNGLPVSVTSDLGVSQYDIARARNQLAAVRVADEIFIALCEVSAAFGVSSARAAWFGLRVAKALAALEGRIEVAEADVSLAVRLVFASRALVAPAAPQQPPEEAPPAEQAAAEPGEAAPAPGSATSGSDTANRALEAPSQRAPQQCKPPGAASEQPTGSLGERVVAATKASLPGRLLSELQPAPSRSAGARQAGRSGSEHISQARGRPTGTSTGELKPGGRINIVATLRAAAPWQRFRRLAAERAAVKHVQRGVGRPTSTAPKGLPSGAAPRIHVIKDDLRLIRFVRRDRSTTIFLVDASGSAALHRLAEVKGAVELMLAESYVRRDRVALISFRGAAAQILLPPTNSLVRAKRELASLPGGGGTPLAIGIDAARVLADSLKRRGESPVVVVLTDGRPNITRDGKGDRLRAEADAVSAARMMRTNSIASLMVDTAPQPRVTTEQFAREMGARYVPLPHADAGALAVVVARCGRDTHHRQLHV